MLIPYIRQSRKKEQTISLDDQLKSIRAWADSAGVKLAPEVVEQGVSGSKPWRERELGRAVEACQRKEADGIVVAFQDRLSRESGLGTAEVWEALQEAGARLVASSEGLDTATGDHELLFAIKAAIARDAWKRHRLNWANAKHASWEAGQYVAAAPSGYDRADDGGLVPNSQAEAIRRAFELRAATPRGSWAEVEQVFSEAGVVSRYGSSFRTRAGLRFVIQNEVYAGLHRCSCGCGESVVRPDWEIVPGWLWRKAQPGPEDVRQVSRGEGHPLGQGLVRCGTCGAGLTRNVNERGEGLRCPTRGGGHVSIRYPQALEWIMLEAARYIGVVRLDDGSEAERAEAEQAVADARAALAEVEEMLGRAAPTDSKPAVAVREAEDRLAGIGRPEGLDLGSILTPLGVKQHVGSLPVPEQRRVLHSIIDKIVLHKPNEGHSSRDPLLASQRGEARDRLTVYFEDGSVSPVKHKVYDADMNEVPVPSIEEMEQSDDPFFRHVAAAQKEAGLAA